MDDPEKHICSFRSAGRLAATVFKLNIEQLPWQYSTRTLYIRLTGNRYDDRSRSASPSRLQRTDDGETAGKLSDRRYSLQRMPPKLVVYAAPAASRWNGEAGFWWAHVVPSGSSMENVRHQVAARTGRDPVVLDEIQMLRSVAEKDVSSPPLFSD